MMYRRGALGGTKPNCIITVGLGPLLQGVVELACEGLSDSCLTINVGRHLHPGGATVALPHLETMVIAQKLRFVS